MAQNMIGRVFSGRYKLTERIGIGGMAEVYRAEDTVLGRVVAVKVMLPQYASDKEFTDRFRQEAASAANLQNPYIVNIYDWGQDNNDYYIVMEYVRGSDLKTGIKARGPINQRKVAEIANQVCQALSTAHSQDIIHRDIKPQNIIVQPDGNVKVMDFGIARAKNSVKNNTSAVLGTAHYISPEQAQGKELTQASDIYSLGCVMYEAVTGKLPFDGPDAVSVAMKQVNESAPAPRSIKPEINPNLEKIIGMAMNKDPKKRFSTARDMQAALNDFLAGRPVNLGAGAAKTAVIAGLGGAVAGAAIGSAYAGANAPADKTGVMSPSAVQQRAQKDYRSANSNQQSGKKPSNKKPGKSKKKWVVFGIFVALIAAALIFWFVVMKPVPDVVGKELEDAKTSIEASHLKVGQIEKRHDPNVKENCVISQDPSALSRIFEGSEIKLVVSLGAEMISVPDVTGKTRADAADILERAGFKVEYGDEEYSKNMEPGRICKQSPDGGTKAAKGSVIKLIISKGTESIQIPDVINYSEGDARSRLESAGFSVKINREYSETVQEGFVMEQSPNGGAKSAKGSTVTIKVSKGTNSVTVPDVVGNTVAQAKSTLQVAGFNVTVSGAGEKVISMNPVAGNKVEKGSTITINIG